MTEDQVLGEIEQAERAPAPLVVERLILPKGALLAYRKSGGLKFSSREIVVYPDGRISYGGADAAKFMHERTTRKLNDAQIARLRKTLARANFLRVASAAGKPPADGFAHEIVARLGNQTHTVEAFDGNIPDSLTELLAQLSAWLPRA